MARSGAERFRFATTSEGDTVASAQSNGAHNRKLNKPGPQAAETDDARRYLITVASDGHEIGNRVLLSDDVFERLFAR